MFISHICNDQRVCLHSASVCCYKCNIPQIQMNNVFHDYVRDILILGNTFYKFYFTINKYDTTLIRLGFVGKSSTQLYYMCGMACLLIPYINNKTVLVCA
jgi:hypothetical protein